MDAQLLGHEEGREDFKWDIEKRKGGGSFDGFGAITWTLGADRVYIDPAALRSATSFDQSKNFNKSEKILIGRVMSFDHIR